MLVKIATHETILASLHYDMNLKSIFQLIVCLAIPLAVGALSGFITAREITGDWFILLTKPGFNPPNSLFGPVWTVLYALMGVSLFMIWNSEASETRTNALLVFFGQLFLNFWWSVFFFSFQRPDVALGEIILLWLSIIYMILAFKKIKPVAAYLQIPYLLWVSFASVLNGAIWWLNRLG